MFTSATVIVREGQISSRFMNSHLLSFVRQCTQTGSSIYLRFDESDKETESASASRYRLLSVVWRHRHGNHLTRILFFIIIYSSTVSKNFFKGNFGFRFVSAFQMKKTNKTNNLFAKRHETINGEFEIIAGLWRTKETRTDIIQCRRGNTTLAFYCRCWIDNFLPRRTPSCLRFTLESSSPVSI